MSDQPKAEVDYPTTEAWFADLDHAGCTKDPAGVCREIHCVFCGVALDGGGMVRCSCAGAAEAWGRAR